MAFEPVRQPPYPDALRPDEAPEPHPLLAPLTGFLGTWTGRGHGGYPTLADEFVQPEGRVEALITPPTGIAEILVGRVDDGTLELATHQVALTPTAKEVTATRRRYILTDAATLDFVHDLAAVGRPLQHHLSARLRHGDRGRSS
jgi:hypothetical protein